ncbi:nucleotidyltransferase family protein [Carboxydothermus hydrogenoformans]|uniref:Nucleotidyltransferase family protein n=1 Tax=Carboxydothermus hydrogenoformans (strain ATCC BAA-161 / DSM 6008 / Z-2901) TaxID=246194 RepID=Q3A955_CARHZ|nr:nucleotidyltransferase family protein [Carboxydothermus hydrogenoformans]ABB13738.1 nucleotidyltransferase family protein [Carboxydothermus hydrogenoformans Z-2901]
MEDKNFILNKLLENKNLLKTYNVSKIGLFGSFVRNEASQTSDIDLLIDFDEPVTIFQFVELKNALEELFKRKVDLGTFDAIKPVIMENILREAIIIEGL